MLYRSHRTPVLLLSPVRAYGWHLKYVLLYLLPGAGAELKGT